MSKRIIVTSADIKRLEDLTGSNSPLAGLDALGVQLDNAHVVAPEKVSKNIVTMNTRVRVEDLDRGGDLIYSVVFPAEANGEQHKVSVLAPVGSALLGRRVGDVVKFSAPGGLRKLKILTIEYQPEAAARDDDAAKLDGGSLGGVLTRA